MTAGGGVGGRSIPARLALRSICLVRPAAPRARAPTPALRRRFLSAGRGSRKQLGRASGSCGRWRVPAVRTSGLMVLEVDGRKVPAMSKKSETRPSEPRQPLVPTGRTTAWGPSGAQSGVQQGLQAQDWVCEPQQRGRPSRHWSVSIDERRQLAVLGARERPDAARSSSHCSDIAHTVAELVSDNVDRDVLLPHPPQSAASNHAFHAFLTRSAPFWQNAKMEARSPQTPPS